MRRKDFMMNTVKVSSLKYIQVIFFYSVFLRERSNHLIYGDTQTHRTTTQSHHLTTELCMALWNASQRSRRTLEWLYCRVVSHGTCSFSGQTSLVIVLVQRRSLTRIRAEQLLAHFSSRFSDPLILRKTTYWHEPVAAWHDANQS